MKQLTEILNYLRSSFYPSLTLKDGYVWSSDGIAGFRIKESLIPDEIKEKTPTKSSRICDNSIYEGDFIKQSFSMKLLNDIIDNEKPIIIFDSKICDCCGGDCYVEWYFKEFKKEDKCPKCDGYGEVGFGKGREVIDYGRFVKLGTHKYQLGHLILLRMMLLEYGSDNVVFLETKSRRRPTKFSIIENEVEFISMPYFLS